jgi:hypothetical protein
MEQTTRGYWVPTHVYAERFGLNAATLANKRHHDLQAGRSGPLPGEPIYRRFGRIVRYWIAGDEHETAVAVHPNIEQRQAGTRSEVGTRGNIQRHGAAR